MGEATGFPAPGSQDRGLPDGPKVHVLPRDSSGLHPLDLPDSGDRDPVCHRTLIHEEPADVMADPLPGGKNGDWLPRDRIRPHGKG